MLLALGALSALVGRDDGTMAGVSKPAVATRPAARPATALATRPATQPATSPAVMPAFEPLLDAVAGEWARFSTLGGGELRYEVIRTTAGFASVRVTVLRDGRPLGQPALRENLRDFDPLARQFGAGRAERRTSRTKIEAAGRTWDAQLYEDRWTDEDIAYLRRTWVSPDAPVYGLIRMELYGDGELEARLELKGFGSGRQDGEMER